MLHGRRKDVPFLRNGSTVFNKTVMASMGTVNLGWAVLTNIVPLYFFVNYSNITKYLLL